MNRDELIDVLTVVAGAYNRTIGETDIQVWGPVLADVPKAHALEAVRQHLRECPGVWLEPGHIYQRWKAFRRDQSEKEHTQRVLEEGRAARNLALEQANRDHIARLTELLGRPDYTRPSRSQDFNPLSVPCPYEACRASVGYVCTNSAFGRSKPRTEAHPSRIDAARVAHGASAATTTHPTTR